jgi:hypothetical protein
MWIVWINAFDPYMWMRSSAACLDVVPDPINGLRCPCEEKRENLSTTISTEIAHLSSNPHFGRHRESHPYVGVPYFGNSLVVPNFSTPKGTYPQIIATYPQVDCLNKINSLI